MKQNIGIGGRYIRLVTGILALNYATTLHRKNNFGRTFMASLGAMKVAEGVIGWCPTVEIRNKLFPTEQQPQQSSQNKIQDSEVNTNHSEHKNKTQQADRKDFPDSQKDTQSKPELKLAERRTEENEHNTEKYSDVTAETEAF